MDFERGTPPEEGQLVVNHEGRRLGRVSCVAGASMSKDGGEFWWIVYTENPRQRGEVMRFVRPAMEEQVWEAMQS